MPFQFNPHRNLVGEHAFLGASNYHWLNYDDARLLERYYTYTAAQRGTELHNFAAFAIKLGIKLSDNGSTISMYVNDAISYGLTQEQPLYYSENCFGTADGICFRNKVLRIHDLKTGESPTSMWQLRIYAALFCLEYHIDPESICTILQIYQKGEVTIEESNPKDIREVMDKIVHCDKLLTEKKREEVI